MYKMAFIGEKELALPLRFLGIETFDADTPAKALAMLREKAASSLYSIILVPEHLAREMNSQFMAVAGAEVTVIPLPGARGGFDLVRETLSQMSRTAIGKEIKIGQ